MPSHLRVQSSFEPVEAQATYQRTATPSSPQHIRRNNQTKPSRMSLTQTYYVASTARAKLGREAARADHNLRRLVGHANMLDQLMLELSNAEAEQDAWFNGLVRTAAAPEESRRAQWVDRIAEEDEEEEDDESVYDDDEAYDSEEEEDLDADMFNIPLRRIKSPPLHFSLTNATPATDDVHSAMEVEEDEEIEDADIPTHSPPELTYDDSDSEDDMPGSPPSSSMAELSEKQRRAAIYEAKTQSEQVDELVQRQQRPMIAAC